MKKLFFYILSIILIISNYAIADDIIIDEIDSSDIVIYERDSLNVAYEYYKPIYTFGEYVSNVPVYVFGDRVNIRTRPTVKSEIIGRFGIADSLRIAVKADEKQIYEFDGYKESWYLIVAEDKQGNLFNGYVWGGALAKVAIETTIDDEKAWILIGIVGMGEDEKVAVARLVKDGEIISEIEFPTIDFSRPGFFDYTLAGAVLEDKGFSTPIQFIRLVFTYEACDYPNGDVLLILDNSELKYGLTAIYSGGEAGGCEFKYIFPNDKKGEEDKIIITYDCYELDMDNDYEIINRSTSQEIYQWDEEELMKIGDRY